MWLLLRHLVISFGRWCVDIIPVVECEHCLTLVIVKLWSVRWCMQLKTPCGAAQSTCRASRRVGPAGEYSQEGCPHWPQVEGGVFTILCLSYLEIFFYWNSLQFVQLKYTIQRIMQHHHSNFRTFCHPKMILHIHWQSLSCSPQMSQPQSQLYFLCLDFPVLDISCKWNHIIRSFLWLTSFT